MRIREVLIVAHPSARVRHAEVTLRLCGVTRYAWPKSERTRLAKRTTGWTDTYACPPHTSDGGMPQDEAGVSNTPMLSGHPHYVNEKKFRKTVQECRNTCQKTNDHCTGLLKL